MSNHSIGISVRWHAWHANYINSSVTRTLKIPWGFVSTVTRQGKCATTTTNSVTNEGEKRIFPGISTWCFVSTACWVNYHDSEPRDDVITLLLMMAHSTCLMAYIIIVAWFAWLMHDHMYLCNDDKSIYTYDTYRGVAYMPPLAIRIEHIKSSPSTPSKLSLAFFNSHTHLIQENLSSQHTSRPTFFKRSIQYPLPVINNKDGRLD